MRTLLLLLLLPVIGAAQVVNPVVSKDYMELINKQQGKLFYIDTTNNARNALLKIKSLYHGYAIQKIRVKKGYLYIQPARPKYLYLSGNFNSSVAIKTINHLPTLQDEYVQGRSSNGSFIWRGAETNEQFSYGPSINSLEYDGSNYAYDMNGKLVSAGTGNGRKISPYRNTIFRTSSLLSNHLSLQGRCVDGGSVYTTKLKVGKMNEQTVIQQNKNSSMSFSLSQDLALRIGTISASFSTVKDRFSNSNRNGFLNRVYQNSLLTPISFDNAQGFVLGNDQRRFSTKADNPFFLLNDNNNSFTKTHKVGSLGFDKRFRNVRFKILQSIEKTNENANEAYKQNTAGFPNGAFVNRIKNDGNYFFSPGGSFETRYGGGHFRSTGSLNYILSNSNSRIDYGSTKYNYKRTAHDLDLNYMTTFESRALNSGLRVGNKFYASNTSLQNDFFLPELSGYILFYDILDARNFNFKIASGFINFNSELPVSTSFAQYGSTLLSAVAASEFFPVKEVNSFKNLLPVRHKEWTLKAELNYKFNFSLNAEFFNRMIYDDIFPVHENGQLLLKNLADHRIKGGEISISYNSNKKKLITSNTISFSTYRNIVTEVRAGYDFTPIAGFSDIHKAIVNGNPLGIIVGNRFLRNNKNEIMIGSNGFPIVDAMPSVIGDPTPDFVMKANNNITWKDFTLNLDCEWKNGGEMWNGTQAVLDHFGRSKASALLRNVTGYIFQGTLENGHSNNVPVNFYDPNLPIEENRWVRYGYAGVAEEYIEKADYVRINNLAFSYKLNTNRSNEKKYVQTVSFTVSASNLIVWSAYKGADPNQLLFDQANSNGLDFFNIPSAKNYALSVSIQF